MHTIFRSGIKTLTVFSSVTEIGAWESSRLFKVVTLDEFQVSKCDQGEQINGAGLSQDHFNTDQL